MIDTPCGNALSGEMAEELQFERRRQLAAFDAAAAKISLERLPVFPGRLSGINRPLSACAAGSRGPKACVSRHLDERGPAGMKNSFGNINRYGYQS